MKVENVVKTKERICDKSEDYQKGYYDGYHKGYDDKKSEVNKVKKELKEEYRQQLENLDICGIYPFNLVYELSEERNENEKFSFSPECIMKTLSEDLSYAEETVLKYQYLDKLTLDEIGKKLSVTRERVRQISERAKHKLNHPTTFKKMRVVPYYDYFELEERYKNLKTLYNYLKTTGESYEDVLEKTKFDNTMIEDLDFSLRTYNALKRNGVQTLGELIHHSEDDVMKFRNLGKKSLMEIKSKLIELGVGFRVDF